MKKKAFSVLEIMLIWHFDFYIGTKGKTTVFWNSTKSCTTLDKTIDNLSAEQNKL